MSIYQPKKDNSYKNKKREIIYLHSSNRECTSICFVLDLSYQMWTSRLLLGVALQILNPLINVIFDSPNWSLQGTRKYRNGQLGLQFVYHQFINFRNCIGQQFALNEMKTVLVKIFRRSVLFYHSKYSFLFLLGRSWSWSYVSWIYHYLCNQ
jgi:hypothetical protein